jgi:hypothetical protein
MMESFLIKSTTFHIFPHRQISFFIAIFFLFSLLLFPSDVIASDESYIRRSNHQVWQLIQKKISPPPSSYRPADLRKSSHQVRFLEKSPIDYKERDLGSQEAKGSFQGSVRPRSEDLNLLPRFHESSTSFYGSAEGRNVMNSERSIPQPRIKKKRKDRITADPHPDPGNRFPNENID